MGACVCMYEGVSVYVGKGVFPRVCLIKYIVL